jgi:hypothetical protein
MLALSGMSRCTRRGCACCNSSSSNSNQSNHSTVGVSKEAAWETHIGSSIFSASVACRHTGAGHNGCCGCPLKPVNGVNRTRLMQLFSSSQSLLLTAPSSPY